MTRGVWFGLSAVFLVISGISYFARRPQPANIQTAVVSTPAPVPNPSPPRLPTPKTLRVSSSPADDTATPQRLPAPRQLSPMDGARIDLHADGLWVLLSWAGAVSYLVEVDGLLDDGMVGATPGLPKWVPWYVSPNLTETEFLYKSPGARPRRRWRVRAVFDSGRTAHGPSGGVLIMLINRMEGRG
jgi:hypothetical protein